MYLTYFRKELRIFIVIWTNIDLSVFTQALISFSTNAAYDPRPTTSTTTEYYGVTCWKRTLLTVRFRVIFPPPCTLTGPCYRKSVHVALTLIDLIHCVWEDANLVNRLYLHSSLPRLHVMPSRSSPHRSILDSVFANPFASIFLSPPHGLYPFPFLFCMLPFQPRLPVFPRFLPSSVKVPFYFREASPRLHTPLVCRL